MRTTTTDYCYDLVPRGWLEGCVETFATWAITALVIIGPVVAADVLRVVLL